MNLYYKTTLSFIRKGEEGDTGRQGTPGRQGAAGEKGQYIPELDEIIRGSIGIQGDVGKFDNLCNSFVGIMYVKFTYKNQL